MNKLSTLALAIAMCAGSVFAQTAATAEKPMAAPSAVAVRAAVPASSASSAFPKPAASAAAAASAVSAGCDGKSVDKNGKPLNGAAKAASAKKCISDASPSAAKTDVKPAVAVNAASTPAQAACEAKAVSKEGKVLSGAAKSSSVKKCVSDATPAKK